MNGKCSVAIHLISSWRARSSLITTTAAAQDGDGGSGAWWLVVAAVVLGLGVLGAVLVRRRRA